MRAAFAVAAIFGATTVVAEPHSELPISAKTIPAVVKSRVVDAAAGPTHEICLGECNDERGFVISRPIDREANKPPAPIAPETSSAPELPSVPGMTIVNKQTRQFTKRYPGQ